MSEASHRSSAELILVRQFLAVLASAQVLSDEELVKVQMAWQDREDDDAQILAKELTQEGVLTRYQAAAIFQNKTRGLVINDYVVVDRLGSGAMGTVYKARHRFDNTHVAIKLMSSASKRSVDSVKRFQREAETAARLNHPNIVRAIEAGVVGDLPFFAMEYIEGRDLSKIVAERGPLPLFDALDYALQTAHGLSFAHSHGITHRDIKPANLLVDNHGLVRILDLGLAKNDGVGGEQAHTQLTMTSQVMGTIDYMAPEQALNTRNADARSDIYSLGCTLYRLLTDQPVYTGETITERLFNHRELPIPSLRGPRPEIPPGVDAVLSRMLAKRPDDRFQSMSEVILALQSAPSMSANDAHRLQATMPINAQSVGTSPIIVQSATVVPTAATLLGPQAMAVTITGGQVEPSPTVVFDGTIDTKRKGRKSEKGTPILKWAAAFVGATMLAVSGVFIALETAGNRTVVVNSAPTPNQVDTPEKAPTADSPPAPHPSPVETKPPITDRPVTEPVSVTPPVSPPAPAMKSTASSDSTNTPLPPTASDDGKLDENSELALSEQLRELAGQCFYRRSNGTLADHSDGKNADATEFHIAAILLPADLEIPEEQWSEILRLSQLELFSARGTDLNDDHLEELCRAIPNIVEIDASHTKVTDAGLQALVPLSRLSTLHLDGTVVTDRGLIEIAKCEYLSQLSLVDTNITGVGLDHLSTANNLRALDVSGAPIMDDSIKRFQAPKRLRQLTCTRTAITAEGRGRLLQNNPGLRFTNGLLTIADIKHPVTPPIVHRAAEGITPQVATIEREVAQYLHSKSASYGIELVGGANATRLLTLNVGDTSLPTEPFLVRSVAFSNQSCTADDIKQLSRLSALRSLDLHNTDSHDTAIQSLNKLDTLRVLNLEGTQVADAAMFILKNIQGLEVLNLRHTKVSDASIKPLREMSSLRWLNIANTGVTATGVVDLIKGTRSLETLAIGKVALEESQLAQITVQPVIRYFDVRGTGLSASVLQTKARQWNDFTAEFHTDSGVVTRFGARSATKSVFLPTEDNAESVPESRGVLDLATVPSKGTTEVSPTPAKSKLVATFPELPVTGSFDVNDPAAHRDVARKLFRKKISVTCRTLDKRSVTAQGSTGMPRTPFQIVSVTFSQRKSSQELTNDDLLLIKGVSSITSLSLSYIRPAFSAEVLSETLRSLPLLENLNVYLQPKATLDEAGLQGLSSLTRLKRLNLGGYGGAIISDATLTQVGECRMLEHFVFRGTGLTSASADAMGKLSNLTTLDMSGCQSWTDSDFVKLSQGCGKLQRAYPNTEPTGR